MTSDKIESNEQDEPVQFFPASKILQIRAPLTDKNLNAVLREANTVLSNNQDNYLDWVEEDIRLLEAAYQKLSTAPDSEQANRDMFRISHSMMGQGGTLGYPLVTFVLHNLCKFLDASSQMNNQDLRVAALHISTVKQIVTHRLSGKGGEMGNEVIGGLLNVINKRKMEAS